MLRTIGNEIRLTRGDTCRLAVEITFDDGSPYTLKNGDVLTFTLKKQLWSRDAYIRRNADEHGLITLEPEATSPLPYGNYVYDIELRTASGDTITVIPMSAFRLTEEITINGDIAYV